MSKEKEPKDVIVWPVYKVGDRVVCVDNFNTRFRLKVGTVYTVIAVKPSKKVGCAVLLEFTECPKSGWGGDRFALAREEPPASANVRPTVPSSPTELAATRAPVAERVNTAFNNVDKFTRLEDNRKVKDNFPLVPVSTLATHSAYDERARHPGP